MHPCTSIRAWPHSSGSVPLSTGRPTSIFNVHPVTTDAASPCTIHSSSPPPYLWYAITPGFTPMSAWSASTHIAALVPQHLDSQIGIVRTHFSRSSDAQSLQVDGIASRPTTFRGRTGSGTATPTPAVATLSKGMSGSGTYIRSVGTPRGKLPNGNSNHSPITDAVSSPLVMDSSPANSSAPTLGRHVAYTSPPTNTAYAS